MPNTQSDIMKTWDCEYTANQEGAKSFSSTDALEAAHMHETTQINLKIYFHIKTHYENIRGLLCTILCIKRTKMREKRNRRDLQ